MIVKSFKEYYQILEEDLQSSINQAKKILAANLEAGMNIDTIAEHLSRIVSKTVIENPQQKRFNVDSNIPILAYLLIYVRYLGGDWNAAYRKLNDEYSAYINSPRATGQNILVNSFNELRQKIQQNKWFKPSEEKERYILSWGRHLIEKIHELQVVDSERQQLKSTDTEDVVYEDDAIIVYKADSKSKCIKYGSGSSLCISTRGGGNYYWSYRMGNMRNDGLGMTTYFVYWKNFDQRILIDALGDEDGSANEYSWNPINPNTDRDITPQELITKYPILAGPFSQNVFQFIPYGEKEKRYQWIEENVHYLLDPNLKTLEDYEMFIENFDDESAQYNTGDSGLKYDGWDTIAKKLGQEAAEYLVKKYAGLGNVVDIETQERFLTPKDRQWYLDIIAEQDDYEILNYCKFVKGVKIPEKLIRKLVSVGGYINEYLSAIVRLEDDVANHVRDKLFRYFESLKKPEKISSVELYQNVTDFFMGRNITTDLLNELTTPTYSIGVSDIPLKLIEYYNKNNISIPKPLIKFIVSNPYVAYRYHRNWLKTKSTPPPKILLKTILKSPKSAFYYAKDLRYAGRGGDIPEEVENAILKDSFLAYTYIDQQYNNKGFENYPTDFLVNLFSSGVNGYRYLDEKEGFGSLFERGWKQREEDNRKIRRAMVKNVMDNPKTAYQRLKYGNFNDPDRKDIFMKLLRKSAKQYKQESFKLSQVDIIKELARQVK